MSHTQQQVQENVNQINNMIRQEPTNINLWPITDMSRHDQDIHIISLENVLQRFHSNQRTGLSTNFVTDARLHYGNNQLTPPQLPSYFWLLFKQLFTGFNSILWVGSVLAIIAYQPLGGSNPSITNLSLGIVLFSVIICNAFLNVYQTLKSIKIIASFSKLLPKAATVRREDVEQQIPVNDLVPGDIIIIRMGDIIPADCRFLTCEGLKISSAELTGETKSIKMTIECTSQILMETTNIGFYSSSVEEGIGEAIVIATGDNTILGTMSGTTQENSNNQITNLHREVNRFVLFVIVADIISIIILWITWGGWLQYNHPTFITLTGNIINSIGMIVSFLPVGLPSAITLALAIIAKRMSQQKILGKSLQIVESFNSISVITTDKTGTLTKNKLVVTDVLWDIDEECKVFENNEEKPLKKQKKHRLSIISREISHHSPSKVFPAIEKPLKKQKKHRLSIISREISHHSPSKVFPAIEKPLKKQKKHRLSIISREISHHSPSKVFPAIEKPSISQNNSESHNQFRIDVFDDLLLGAALCNNAKIQYVQSSQNNRNKMRRDSELHVIGDPVDVALYNLCVYQCFMYIDEIRSLNPRLKTLPFNSTNKFMITANRIELNRRKIVLITMKGAPEIIIQRCSSYKTNDGRILLLTNEIKEKLINRQEMLCKKGYRIVGMCQQKFTEIRYDQSMEQYEERKRSQIIPNDDLYGFPKDNYCFMGFFTLFDSLRFDVPDSIHKIRHANIRVAMITGDHPTTAIAIGEQVNIFSEEISKRNGIDTFQIEEHENDQSIFRLYRNGLFLNEHEMSQLTSFHLTNKAIGLTGSQFTELKPIFYEEKEKEKIPYAILVTGSQIDFLDDLMWNWILSHQELIFARTSPEQKLRIIMEFQRRGEIVAAIGDGTNDASSLKYADLGIAMQSGTNVSKEASDMILLDDRFSSIISAIETGRLLADNLRKVVMFLLPAGSWSEFWPIMLNMWLGIPLSLTAFLATILCVLNDVVISLALVWEKPETEILSRPPLNRNKNHLLNWKLLLHAYLFIGNIECFTAFFCYFYYWIDHGISFYSFLFTFESFGINPRTIYDQNQLNQMINISQSIYYCSLCLFQIFNFFSIRTRYASIIQHNPFWGKNKNLYGLIAILISISIQLIFTQIIWFNQIFDTAPVPIKYVMPTIGFGFIWLFIDEFRKFYIRKYPHSLISKIAW